MIPMLDLVKALRSAEGWIDLGLPLEAQRVLDELPSALAQDPIVQVTRVWILCALGHSVLPELADVHILAARAFSRVGQFKEARFHLQQAIDLQPDKASEWTEEADLANIVPLLEPRA